MISRFSKPLACCADRYEYSGFRILLAGWMCTPSPEIKGLLIGQS